MDVDVLPAVMAVIRMVKLFGWEHRLAERVSRKRDEELTWIRARELVKLANSLVKYVGSNLDVDILLIYTASSYLSCN